jgi:alcohol dehydrogenase class IV
MWDISQNRRLLAGLGAVGQIGALARHYGMEKVLLMAYDLHAPGVQGVMKRITDAGAAVFADDSVRTEPSLEDIDRLVRITRAEKCRGIVAVGGGSVLDAAKAVSMIVANGGLMVQYQMEGKEILNPGLPLIAVPTTAGTGSEATRVSVVYNPQNQLKKSIYSPYMIADAVILDAELTVSLPAHITASTGIDALSHAIESYVSLNATIYTEMYGMKAMGLILKSLARCVEEGSDPAARQDMLVASYFAGCAIGAGIGLAHMIAQPLGGLLKIPHGVACAVYLPHAMEYNLEYSVKKYCDIARAMGSQAAGSPQEIAREGIGLVKALLKRVNAPGGIAEFVPESFDLDAAVQKVLAATGHIKCNPRPVDGDCIRHIIQKSVVAGESRE